MLVPNLCFAGTSRDFRGASFLDSIFMAGNSTNLQMSNGSNFGQFAWIYPETVNALSDITRYDDVDGDDGDGPTPRSLYLFRITATSKIEVEYGSTSSTLQDATTTFTVSANTWIFLGFQKDNTNDQTIIYKFDGTTLTKEIFSDGNTGTWTSTGQYMQIGRFDASNSTPCEECFDGQINYVHSYNSRVLSDAEIMEMYFKPEFVPTNQNLLLPVWNDSPEIDLSGSGNIGTVDSTSTTNNGAPVMFGGGLPL